MIQLKDLLNEGFAGESKLASAIKFMKKNAESAFEDDKEIQSVMKDVKASGLVSDDVFSFSALFPRNSFKIDDIRSGKLEAQIKKLYIAADESKALKKAKVLKDFLLAFDKAHDGDKEWYKKY